MFFKDSFLRKFLGVTPKEGLSEGGFIPLHIGEVAAIKNEVEMLQGELRLKHDLLSNEIRELMPSIQDLQAELKRLKDFLGIARYEKTQLDRQIFSEGGVLPQTLDLIKQLNLKIGKHQHGSD